MSYDPQAYKQKKHDLRNKIVEYQVTISEIEESLPSIFDKRDQQKQMHKIECLKREIEWCENQILYMKSRKIIQLYDFK